MTSPNPIFPGGSPQLIMLPAPDRTEGVQSWRVLPPAQTIPSLDLSQPISNASSFEPIVGVYIDCSRTGNDGYQAGSYPVNVRDAMSRVAIYLTHLAPAFNDKTAVGLVPPVAPPDFDLQLRAAGGSISETVAQFQVKGLTTFKENGLLLIVTGYLCSQWELWGRVPPKNGQRQFPVSIKVQFITDRLGNGVPGVADGLFFGKRLSTGVAIQYYP